MVNINYNLSSAYNDVVVPCNDLDVWEFGPLGLCISLGRQWALNYACHLVSEPESFGYRPLRMEQCSLHLEGARIRVFETNTRRGELMDEPLSLQG